MFSLSQNLNYGRYGGYDDDCGDDDRKIIFNDRYISKVITAENEYADPCGTSNDVEEHETSVGHEAETRNERRKCSNYRDEPGEYYCLATVLFIEPVCTFKVFLTDETNASLLDNAGSYIVSYPVVGNVPDDCSHGENDEKPERI